MLGKMISNMMVKPHQSPLFDSPDNYSLDYEQVRFKTRDGVQLHGWLIHGGRGRVVVQSHFGVQCNRAGWCRKGKGLFAPWKKDICFLRQAQHLASNGYSVLMYDFRGHGESELGPTPWVSWGPEEAKDVVAAVEYISNHSKYRDAEIALLSVCMGAAAATYAFGVDDGLREFKNIRAMVAVQPLLYSYFVDALGMPKFLQRAASRVTTSRLGFDLNTKSFLPDVASVNVPTQVIQNRNDPWTRTAMVEQYYNGLPAEKDMMWLDIEPSRFAAYDFVGRSPEAIQPWFDKHFTE